MENGNTAVSISPVPSEEDMNKVRSIFEQGLNSIIGIAQISKDVATLRDELTSLKNDLDYVRGRNRELDQALAEVRSQRDTAMSERDNARAEIDTGRRALTEALAIVENLKHDLETTRNELNHVRTDRDQAYVAWHNAEQAKDDAESKLLDIKEFASRAFGLAEPPKPEPVKPAEPQVLTTGEPGVLAHTDPLEPKPKADEPHEPWKSW